MNALTLHTDYRNFVARRELGPDTKVWLGRARTAALFVAAPFIGLAYAVVFPFAGLVMLLWIGVKAMPKGLKNIVLFFAAPFIGFAYAVAFPFVGLAMIVWAGVRAMK